MQHQLWQGRTRIAVRPFQFKCKTPVCHFQEQQGHGQSQVTGGSLAFQYSLPTAHSLLFSLHGVLRAFLDAWCWIRHDTFARCSWKFLGQKVCLHMACATTATNLVKLKTGDIQASDSFLLNLRCLSQTTEVLDLSKISSCAYVNSPPPV